MTASTAHILSFGEAMALFVADETGPLAEVGSFHRRLAGADNNVAIGLSRLGFPVKWLSRVGRDSLGSYVRKTLEAECVNCAYLIEDATHPTGLMFKARALEGADPAVEYYRRGSAASHMTSGDADDGALSGIRHLHATGITPALSAGCRELSAHLMKEARQRGASISFDPNLRPSLWPSEAEMRETLNALAIQADWVMPGLSEGRLLTGRESPADIAAFYLDQGVRAVIIKLGPEGSFYRGVLNGEDEHFTVPGFSVENVVDTVGAGDAFAVGVISALLDGLPARAAVRRGNLLGAQAVQVVGDMEGLPSRKELMALDAVHTAE
ncbi:sugar kinase [Pseudomonas sp. Marseille-QA0892]